MLEEINKDLVQNKIDMYHINNNFIVSILEGFISITGTHQFTTKSPQVSKVLSNSVVVM